MDSINNKIELSAYYDKYFQTIKTEKKIFCIQEYNKKYYITDFSGNRVKEIRSTSIFDFDFNQAHFCQVELVNTKNNYVVIEVYSINEMKLGIEGLNIQSDKEEYQDLFVMTSLNNQNAVLLAITKFSEKKEKMAIINLKDGTGYYLEKIDETNENTDYTKKSYLRINKKIGRFDSDKFKFVLFEGIINVQKEIKYLQANDDAAITSFQRDITNYVNLWNEYNRIEKELAFNSFKNLEAIKFSSYSIDKVVRVFFDEDNYKKFISLKNNVLLIGNLNIKNLSKAEDFKSYSDLEHAYIDEEQISYATYISENPNEKSVVLNIKNLAIFDNLKTDYGYLICSLQGSATMFRRREAAKEKIICPDYGHLNLRTLFTDDPQPNTKKQEININYNLVKDVKLTENQKEAISIICNTPDIAIIQGPPGTGKTTVINQAIMQINEYAKDKTNKVANNLVSGFRHETVSNLTDRVNLYGLPAIKIGESMDALDKIEPKIEKYITELNDRLEERYKDLVDEDKDFEELRKIYSNYSLFYNSIDSAVDLLRQIKTLDTFKFDSKICQEVDEKINELMRFDDNFDYDTSAFIDLLYELPLNEAAYEDNINDLFVKLQIMEETNNSKLKEDIKQIKSILELKPLNLQLIKNKRRDLIIKYRKVPNIFTTNYQKQGIIDFLDSLYKTAKIDRLKKFNGEALALLDYKNSLHENPFLIRQTLLEYTKVLGATNQQSASSLMAQANCLFDKSIGFDNVFIDEAATSSPLDLFIPMVLAKDRLVLVGDHKQLPHIINESITDEIEEELKKDNKDTSGIKEEFKTTLFEYLIDKAHALEMKDGKRRVITLNNQYRMHPKLGNLVSRYFYQDEGGLNSPRPESDFSHNYHGLKDQYLFWIDNKGKNSFANGSRYNIQEAELIAKHIQESIATGTYHSEPIAIITFYRAQVKVLQEACKKYGLFDAMGKARDGIDLDIGTVDAFQGREFDYVYLATTYSVGAKDQNPFQKCRLNDDNLLCVALSREKKLLIVVGNKEDYINDNAKKYVPSLYEVNRICNGN